MSWRRSKCFVPNCPNSMSKTQDKVFVHVNNHLKRKWCNQLNIDYKPKQHLYCCEDHLNLNEDLDNYYQWKLMKATPKLKSTAILRYSLENVFSTEDNRCNYQIPIRNETSRSQLETLLLHSTDNIPKATEKDNKTSFTLSTCAGPLQIDVATQCNIVKMVDKSTATTRAKDIVQVGEPFLAIDMESTSITSASPSMYGSTMETEDVSDSDHKEGSKEKGRRKHIIALINENPKMYLGLPKQYLWIIEEIAKQMSGKQLDIIITLLKIKLNDSMVRLGHQFELSKPSVTASFCRGLIVLGSYFRNFVFMPEPAIIKRNLPLVFKIRYSNVQCILDAFEIEIEKPSDPQSQAQTWSQYKLCNTIKYLVGCTPNGFICYVCKGYGGRISDKALVETSDLLEKLPINSVIMADRGFKGIEAFLSTKNIKLLRPPSVYSANKPSKEEVLQTKVIASLRVHIERVIRRIREFKMLKPHSVVSHKHVGYLDHIVIVACGLINLQNEIIKQ